MGNFSKEKNTPASSKGFESVAPTQTPMLDHSFTLQAIMENQRTLGELKGSMDTLKASVDAQGKKLEKHGNIIAVATGAVSVAIVVASFVIDKLWDKVASLVTLNLHH